MNDDKFVAYIDILGFKDMVLKRNAKPKLQRFHRLVYDIWTDMRLCNAQEIRGLAYSDSTISPKLPSCKKLMLYISGANKEIAGEADIKSISLMTLSEIILKYGSNLLLTEDELRKYSNGRDSKKMMVFKLGRITPYPEPKELGHGITMVREYISNEEYNLLTKKYQNKEVI